MATIEQKEIKFELDAYETLTRFCDELKASTDERFENILIYCQLTWKSVATSPRIVFRTLREHVVSGKIHVKAREKISDVCWIYLVKTSKGSFTCKVIREKEPYKPSINGVWGVNPLSFRHLMK